MRRDSEPSSHAAFTDVWFRFPGSNCKGHDTFLRGRGKFCSSRIARTAALFLWNTICGVSGERGRRRLSRLSALICAFIWFSLSSIASETRLCRSQPAAALSALSAAIRPVSGRISCIRSAIRVRVSAFAFSVVARTCCTWTGSRLLERVWRISLDSGRTGMASYLPCVRPLAAFAFWWSPSQPVS